MKIKGSKKPKLYLKSVYASQLIKPQKQNDQFKEYSENARVMTDYNSNQAININPSAFFFNKKSLYQNCYSNKTFLLKASQNFLSQKNILNQSNKNNKNMQISLGIITDSNISSRKSNIKNYEIMNPFKERSNSENKINCFNRTYSFFNNNNNNNNLHKAYLNTKPNVKNKQMKNSPNKKSINLDDISYQNMPTKLYKISKENSKNNISPVKNKNDKKYFYKNKKISKNVGEVRQSISKIQKKSRNPLSPLIDKNIDSKNMTTPNYYKYSKNSLNINSKNTGRIQKYILSDKRKIKSKQFFRQFMPISKTVNTNNENKIKKYNYSKSPENKDNNKIIDNSILNSPSLPSIKSYNDEYNKSKLLNKKFIWMKKTNNLNKNYLLYEINNNHINQNSFKNKKINKNIKNNFSPNSTLECLFSNIDKNEIKGIEEKDLFEQSATTIQSAFRGYLFKNKFERNLYNYKDYSKGYDILEKRINYISKRKLFNYLKNQKNMINKDDYTYKSSKSFKLSYLPTSSFYEKEVNQTKYFKDLILHKEIGERFNIIQKNNNKELEKKYKEELNCVNKKMNELIVENNKLKEINKKIQYKESKYEELTIDNKKKDNIINIITNDNQNLAKKLKVIKDKYSNLDIHNKLNLSFNPDNNQYNLYNNSKELFIEYRNFYLLFLIHKKNVCLLDILRRYFNKYKNIIRTINDKRNINYLLREQKLKVLIRNKINKKNYFLRNNFIKFFYNGLINYKETENRNNIIREKLKNIFINKEKDNKKVMKSSFYKFYYKGIISHLIEERNKSIIDKKTENDNKIKKLIISMEQRKDKHNYLIKRDCFDKWNLFSKILGMKSIMDEKKRKKRQKQRMKKKIENKSANKYLTNNNNILHLGKNNNINIINKGKDKDVLFCIGHSVTDFSSRTINEDNKDKIIKATEKLGEIFYKAMINSKLFENKKSSINTNKEINENNKNEIIKKTDNNENDNEYEEDSGDSFGI